MRSGKAIRASRGRTVTAAVVGLLVAPPIAAPAEVAAQVPAQVAAEASAPAEVATQTPVAAFGPLTFEEEGRYSGFPIRP
jgi:hypothetical protein